MSEKTARKGFFSNWIVRNLLIAFVIVVVLIVGAMVFLNVATKHNQVLIVPDFSNMTVAEAEAAAQQVGMRVEVTDSVFAKRMRKGAVSESCSRIEGEGGKTYISHHQCLECKEGNYA